jgi:hypothetical protein
MAFDWELGAQAAMASHSAARKRYHSTLGTTNSLTISARILPSIGQMQSSKFSSEKDLFGRFEEETNPGGHKSSAAPRLAVPASSRNLMFVLAPY